MAGAEVGPVAAEDGDPLLPGLGHVGRDEVRGVGHPSAGHADVGRGGAGLVTDHHVRGGDGVTLHAVRGAGVGQLHVLGDVVGGQHPDPCAGRGDIAPGDVTGGRAGGDQQPTASADRGDGPRVSVGHLQVAVVAPGGDPVAGADPLTRPRGHDPDVVDPAVGDQPVADGGVELVDLLAGVRHHGDVGRPAVAGGGRGQGVLQRRGVGVQVDPAAGEEGVEHRARGVTPPHRQRQLGVLTVRNRLAGAVGAGEAVHRLQRQAGGRVDLADGEVEDAAAADRGELVAVPQQRQPRPGTRRRR